jgi:hypothetical protein
MCGYLPHIENSYFVDFTLQTVVPVSALDTKDSQLQAMISIVRLPRRCVLVADVTVACDVSVTRPSPCARLPQLHSDVTWPC